MANPGSEVRIGLVLYGGVSLAVYIYGIVVEVQRLLRASAELEKESGSTPADRGVPSSFYGEVLRTTGNKSVSIDLLSGTSAGGINGILLAKALARGSDVAAARDLWIEGGDIEQLLQPPSVQDPRSLLQSKAFERTLASGLSRLDRREDGAIDPPSILDLFVSSTHVRGGERLFVDSLDSKIPTRQHRYVFQLKLRTKRSGPTGPQSYEADDFLANERLIKLARATSAFPFAFEPVDIEKPDGLLADDEEGGWFADGGILNNKPFTEAVETIATRASDRPVERWLFSVDPDPEAIQDPEPAGEMPPFDQIVIRSIATIPRYQSIARDLLALEEHNQKVAASEIAIFAAEQELAEAGNDADSGLGPGLDAFYETLRRQSWGVAVADRLMEPTTLSGPGRLDTAGVHLGFRIAAEAALPEAENDWALQLRALYYLIKLIAMTRYETTVNLAALKDALWREFEAVSLEVWTSLQSEPVRVDPSRQRADAQELAAQRIAGSGARLQEVVGGSRERTRRLLAVLDAIRLGWIGRAVVSEPEREVSVHLDRVFDGFRRRDSVLIAADVYGGLRARDRIEHAQISPVAARNTGVPASGRLAGATLGHFGGFLDRGWRRNDLMWGRLDAAEILTRAIAGTAPTRAGELVDLIQHEILAEERPELADGDWKKALRRHAEGDVSDGQLTGRRLVSIGLRAAAVVRKMLATAAAEGPSGSVLGRARAVGLRSAANALGFVLALFYLPATAVFAKRQWLRRGVILAVFLIFVWGLATLALGVLGVLSLSDVAQPAGIAIAAYPLFLLGCWVLMWAARRIQGAFRRSRPRSDLSEKEDGRGR